MNQLTLQHNETKIHYTLRFASAMCFIGHGTFGIIGKKIWLNYFAVFGINSVLGTQLMPWLGAIDILMGISILLYPTRAVLGWLMIWGAVTAFCRPMSGEPFAEFIERAGNFGAPFTLLLLSGFNLRDIKSWFTRVSPDVKISPDTRKRMVICLRIIVCLLFIGHGWLNLIEKKGIVEQYTSLGFSNPVNVAHIVGLFEILAAISVLIKPLRPLLLAFLVWKMGSELFYPHWELFEFIERGGSYGAILALWLALPASNLLAGKRVKVPASIKMI
ncbi:DoxX family protein [Mucilaginibacter ginsenosidivorans]|uniref:DoxX family membrane protein n=2 Tax=Mucilaginibacter ginsenosidivorans TaxID=398053 RepID=A0A5B8UY44_9SPHI|nr:DoxX family membrane protein [Mucilaginibacter ginsenosidivorans]QEC64117.1 DoxX family membrane protein [Mucilaginibacter ginsenosidivorans]